MQRNLTILTGASRGMGFAMAGHLMDAGHDLLCISRKHNDELAARAARAGVQCEQWTRDLSQPEPLAHQLESWFAALDPAQIASITLINNAGMLPRIAPLAAISAGDLAAAIRVDLEAPLLLTSAFLRATQAWSAGRKVLNISSGLGRRAMASQAPYCAAKAGMDLFTACVALEEAGRRNGARVCSLAPGVIDTDMQAQLRSADASQFPDKGHFTRMKARGVLSSPAEAAAKVLAFLASPDYGSKPVADIRD